MIVVLPTVFFESKPTYTTQVAFFVKSNSTSFPFVMKTWEKMAQATEYDAQLIMVKMSEEQPLALGFLINLDDMPFNQNEREIILYVGVTVWRMMLQGERQLLEVTDDVLERAEDANLDWMEKMEIIFCLSDKGENDAM